MPWANDGGTSWNAFKCAPIDPNPKQVGEPCTVLGSGVSGIDDCDVAAMCFYVDPDTNTGECVAMCTGSIADPMCSGGCELCMIANDGVLALCLPACDPMLQDCGDGRGCYPVEDGFVCLPQTANVGPGECEWLNGCPPGEVCVPMDSFPDCMDPAGCCAPLCDIDAADPCPGAPPQVSCENWWIESPPDVCMSWSGVGVCT
jgi:hypothetical protein